jgi:hypothetical protein
MFLFRDDLRRPVAGWSRQPDHGPAIVRRGTEYAGAVWAMVIQRVLCGGIWPEHWTTVAFCFRLCFQIGDGRKSDMEILMPVMHFLWCLKGLFACARPERGRGLFGAGFNAGSKVDMHLLFTLEDTRGCNPER